MSPASAGSIKVERYIGACLISQRPQDQYWAAESLARLAVHAQGAPLVLAKTYNHRKSKSYRNPQVPPAEKKLDVVAEDACLPRIIKPRKRRKKDRKLPPLNMPTSSSEHSYVALNQFTTLVRDPCHLLDDLCEAPDLHHSFEDVEEADLNGNQSSCQCRLCDPNGQIWDVDRECYSPFLTPSWGTLMGCLERGLSSVSLEDEEQPSAKGAPRSPGSSSSCSSDLEVSTEIVTSLNGHRDLEIRFFSSGAKGGGGGGGGGFLAEE